jgi:zinc D-Ala-D-Ala carboxypeptidase
MYLSANFTVSEFVASQTAAREDIDNDIPIELLPAARQTAYGLEMIRTLLGDRPLLISSGYRSAALNAAVKGSMGSQHLVAEAADFTCPTYGTPAQIMNALVASQIPYDQCILEYSSNKNGGWVHVSFSQRNRKQALRIDKDGTRAYA